MYHKKIKALVTIVLVLSALLSFSQTEDVSNLSSWNAVGLKYKLNKKWSFTGEQHLRFKEGFTEVDSYFSQLEAEYKIIKKFSLGLGLRFIRDNDTEGSWQGYENHFRYHLDAMFKQKLSRFSLGARLRYQNKNELGITTEEGDYAKNNVRLKGSLGYNIKKWPLDPKFDAEIFNSYQEGDEDNGFSKYRLTIGTDFKLKKLGKIKVYYRFQKDVNVEVPEIENIIGLKYTYTIKNK